jgi:hypothetical protein
MTSGKRRTLFLWIRDDRSYTDLRPQIPAKGIEKLVPRISLQGDNSVKKKNRKAIRICLSLMLILGGLLGARMDALSRTEQKTVLEASAIEAASFPRFTNWLDKNGEYPVDYIVDKCREHSLVIVGEHHYIKSYCELFKQALPGAYEKAGVRVVALEVCNAEDNEKIARLIEGKTYDTDLAYEIARSENWGLWGYKEYWDILEAVWNLNRSLPPGADHMRVVGIDKAADYQLDSLWRANKLNDPALIEKAKNQPDIYKRDEWLMENIEKETFIKGSKGIVLIGFNHSFTHYCQPRIDKEGKLVDEWPRMGVLLLRKYGDRVFQIGLHGDHMSPAQIDKAYKGPEPVFVDLIEKIMASEGNKPVGFDVVGSPFAGIRDDRSYYFHWQPDMTFDNICRGFVFLMPVKELKPCSWMKNFVSDEMFKKCRDFYEFSYGRTFKNAQEVNEFFESGLKTL